MTWFWCLILSHVCFDVENSGLFLHRWLSRFVSWSCCNTRGWSPITSSVIDTGFSQQFLWKSEIFFPHFLLNKEKGHTTMWILIGCLTQNCWLMKSYNSTPCILVWLFNCLTSFEAYFILILHMEIKLQVIAFMCICTTVRNSGSFYHTELMTEPSDISLFALMVYKLFCQELYRYFRLIECRKKERKHFGNYQFISKGNVFVYCHLQG